MRDFMIHDHQGKQLLRTLASSGHYVFNTQTAILTAQQLSIPKNQLNKILSNLFKKGQIHRLRRGLYKITDLLTMADKTHPFVVSAHLIEPSAISHWSAAQYHGLTEQLTSTISASTTKKFVTPSMRSKNKHASHKQVQHGFDIDGVHYEYKTIPEQYYFGIEKIWLNEFSSVFITDKERTLLDIFITPKIFGGMGEALGLLEQALDSIDVKKLIGYAIQYDSKFLIKRLGWALEYFGVDVALLKPALDFPMTYYCRLDPDRSAIGACDKRWMIQNNLGK